VLWKHVNICNTLGLSSTCAVIPAVLICRESRSTHFSSVHSSYYCSAQYTGPEQRRFHSYHGRSLQSQNGQNCLRCQQLHCLAGGGGYGFLFYSETSRSVILHHKQLKYTVGWCIPVVWTLVLHNWKGVKYLRVHIFRGEKKMAQ